MEIINPPTSRLLQRLFLPSAVLLGSAAALYPADVVLQKVPPLTVAQAPAYPENLARYQLGARLESAQGNGAEAALLSADPTVGTALNSGATTLLLSLSKVENIDSVSFLNHGAKGTVAIATSNAKLPADSPEWHIVAEQELTSDVVKAKIGPSEAKYVRLTFNVTEAGHIAGLGVYSTPTVASFAMPRARKADYQQSGTFALMSYNLTDLHAKARAAFVSSGDDVKQANNMIDDQPSTVYNFSTSDATPVAVIDLGKVTKLRRISALYSPGRGTLHFYVLQSLPQTSGNTLRLDEATFAGMHAVGTVTDGENGRAAIDFPETEGRYVMVKWTPAEEGKPFAVAEIAAFGDGRSANLVAANDAGGTREGRASDGKTVLEGKDFKDLGEGKEMPEEGPPAEGPGAQLPNPPPFVFVPEVLPNSP